MNILSDFSKDTQTDKPIPGSYEWWYFDGISGNGYSFVIIFYEGNPFSKRYIRSLNAGTGELARHFPALSISVYKENKPVFYSFEEVIPQSAAFSSENPAGKIGENYFTGVRNGNDVDYTVSLNQQLPNGDSIRGELHFRSESAEVSLNHISGNSDGANHSWNLVQPKCNIEGSLEIKGYDSSVIPISGTGYHDHNFGSEPMKDTFDEWYWGRYHLDDATLIYYIMREKGEWDKKAWILEDNGTVRPAQRITMNEKGLSLFGLETARKINFEGDGFEALIQKDKMIDNGPFYQRFSGNIVLKNGKEIKHARGISEYIYPSRIYKKLFWPLVDMRIKYPGNVHWVQKSPYFYRWTW